MAIYKNVSSQKLPVYAYTLIDGQPKTGDAGNITCRLSIDSGAAAALADTNPTELDSTNMKGWYVFDLAQAETNGELLILSPVSATAGVLLEPVTLYPVNVATLQSGLATQTSVNDLPTNAELATALDTYGALKPTTAGRTLDVTASGNAGIDWSNIESPGAVVSLVNTDMSFVGQVSGAVMVSSLAAGTISFTDETNFEDRFIALDAAVAALPDAATVADAVLDEPKGTHTGWLTKLLSEIRFLALK